MNTTVVMREGRVPTEPHKLGLAGATPAPATILGKRPSAGIPKGSPVVAPDARREAGNFGNGEPPPLIRACASCEQEAGVLDRTDSLRSHGLCRRHFKALLEEAGLGEAAIATEMAVMRPQAFCQDLKELEASC